MKKEFVAIFLFLANIFIAAQTKPFEGIIKYHVKITNPLNNAVEEKNYAYSICGNKFRIEKLDEKEKPFTIIDTAKTVYHYKDSKNVKTSMELTKEQLDNDTYDVEYRTKTKLLLQNNITDETKEILGFICRKIIYKEPKLAGTGFYECEKWVVMDKNVLMACDNFEILTTSMDECFENGMIPLLVITRLDDGQEIERLEAVKIEEKKLKKSIFDFPKGYKNYESSNEPEENYDEDEDDN